jgi:hypothetical protein
MNDKISAQIVDEFIEAEYGLSFKQVKALSDLCAKKEAQWYQLFYISQKEEDKIAKALVKKYKKHGLRGYDIAMLSLCYGASPVKERVDEALKKVSKNKKIMDIVKKSKRYKQMIKEEFTND